MSDDLYRGFTRHTTKRLQYAREERINHRKTVKGRVVGLEIIAGLLPLVAKIGASA